MKVLPLLLAAIVAIHTLTFVVCLQAVQDQPAVHAELPDPMPNRRGICSWTADPSDCAARPAFARAEPQQPAGRRGPFSLGSFLMLQSGLI